MITKINQEKQQSNANHIVAPTNSMKIIPIGTKSSTNKNNNNSCQINNNNINSSNNINSNHHNHHRTYPQSLQHHTQSNSMHRCFVCFKLVRNSKGNKLSHFFDLSSVASNDATVVPIPNSHSFFNGEHLLRNNKKSTENNNDATNLVNNNNNNNNLNSNTNYISRQIGSNLNNRRSNTSITSNTTTTTNTSKRTTVGESILKTLRELKKSRNCFKPRVETLLNDNLIYMKKICENCYRQFNSINYHLSNAFKLCDLMTFKLNKSHRLVKSMEDRRSNLMNIKLKRLVNGKNNSNSSSNSSNALSSSNVNVNGNKLIKRKSKETDPTPETRSKFTRLVQTAKEKSSPSLAIFNKPLKQNALLNNSSSSTIVTSKKNGTTLSSSTSSSSSSLFLTSNNNNNNNNGMSYLRPKVIYGFLYSFHLRYYFFNEFFFLFKVK